MILAVLCFLLTWALTRALCGMGRRELPLARLFFYMGLTLLLCYVGFLAVAWVTDLPIGYSISFVSLSSYRVPLRSSQPLFLLPVLYPVPSIGLYCLLQYHHCDSIRTRENGGEQPPGRLARLMTRGSQKKK